jgi:alpha-tubulin suppressor-like RCC1 family protein
MFPLIPDLQKELGEYLSIEELEYLLINNADIDLEYEVISSDKWWRYLAISKYNFTSSELDSFKETPIFKALLPILFGNNKIATGYHQSLALDTNGNLYAWGANYNGQSGLGDGKNITIPTLIKSELTFRTIAAGLRHSLALDTKGKLYAWGNNGSGQLGLGDGGLGENRNIPTPVVPKLNFRTIATGPMHSLALDTKGKLYAWGYNFYEQLGLSDVKNRAIPTLIKSELTFRTIAAGTYHSLALDTKGKLYAWGNNDRGQLGLGDMVNRNIPILIKSELTFRAITGGGNHSLALDTKGKLYAWGNNDRGQLGLGDMVNRNIPTLIKSELTFRAITGGGNHTLALDTKGKLYTWGSNEDGQLGLGDSEDGKNRNTPTPVTPRLTFRTIAAGTEYSLALDTKGKLYAWGNNYFEQLGLYGSEDRKNSNIPTPITI